MKIAVLCIATDLKVRMKVGNVPLLKQDEKKSAARLFSELDLWIRNSDYEIVPVIVTCYNEIYEIAVKMHLTAFNNVFGFVSEENAIRYGIARYPDADAYFVISSGEARFFRAEIFESVCRKMAADPDKIILSRYNGKSSLPMVFAKKHLDLSHSLNEGKSRSDGRFILYSNAEDTDYFDITDDAISDSRFHKAEMSGAANPDDDNEKKDYSYTIQAGQAVVIRGGGRLGSAVALALHRNGYRVLITELQNPETLYTGMSFAQAIYKSEVKIEGVSAFLVTPGKIQIQKAWNSNAIPIIIDQDCEALQLFDQKTGKDSLLKESIYDNTGINITDYLKEGIGRPEEISLKKQTDARERLKSFLVQNRLAAVIDATGSIVSRPTTIDMAPVTIGLRDDQSPATDVKFKVRTDLSSQYGRIVSRSDTDISHSPQKAAAAPSPLMHTIYSPDSGIYTGTRNIGDEIDEFSLIGHIENIQGKKTAIFSPGNGRLIANAAAESYHNKKETVAVIDSSGISKEGCFQTLPVDKAIAYSILSILKNQN
ncbi:MAG: hypothetical protein ACYCYI_12585 [Saccharofermentanales bacterium]